MTGLLVGLTGGLVLLKFLALVVGIRGGSVGFGRGRLCRRFLGAYVRDGGGNTVGGGIGVVGGCIRFGRGLLASGNFHIDILCKQFQRGEDVLFYSAQGIAGRKRGDAFKARGHLDAVHRRSMSAQVFQKHRRKLGTERLKLHLRGLYLSHGPAY